MIARTEGSSLRGGVRLFALAAATVGYVCVHLIAHVRRRPSPWPRRFLARVAQIAGADVQVHGMPLASDVLFVANHQSWLDIPAIAGATGTAFVAQSDVKNWPLVGWLADMNNTVYVDRANRSGVHGQVAVVREALARHQAVAIFPEGTTATELLPFKPSLFDVVVRPPRAIRVQPLRLDYGEAIDLAWIGTEPAPHNAWRVLKRKRRFVITIHCLEPFDPAALGDRKAIAAEARARILSGSAWTPDRV